MEKPFREVYGHKKYNTIYQQAACLMEGIIRFHPFPDGNKRTALLMTSLFMETNDVYLVVPIDVVRFMIKIADDDARDEECIDALICEISCWLEARSAVREAEFNTKMSRYVTKPLWKAIFLTFSVVGIIFARRMFRRWLALDTHSEYVKNDTGSTFRLILDLLSHNKRAAKQHDL